MCIDPVSMMMIASTAFSTVGAIQQGNAQAAASTMQAQVAANNARLVNTQIEDAQERGKREEQRILQEGAQLTGNTRAALASNNLDVGFGSPLDTITESIVGTMRDAYRVRRNTANEVKDLYTQRANFQLGASANRAAASSARTGGFIAGVGTALSGGADVVKYRASLG